MKVRADRARTLRVRTICTRGIHITSSKVRSLRSWHTGKADRVRERRRQACVCLFGRYYQYSQTSMELVDDDVN